MQFVILKDDYKVDEYGIEIKRENPPEFKDLKPAMKVINEYVTTGEFGVEGADKPEIRMWFMLMNLRFRKISEMH